MMTAFERAWSVLKADPILYPRSYETDERTREHIKRLPTAFTRHPKVEGPIEEGASAVAQDVPAFITLPKMGKWGRPQARTEEEEKDLINRIMEAHEHENMHRVMALVGELGNNPQHNEYPAIMAEALQFARRPIEDIPAHDEFHQMLESGMDPREIALAHAKQFTPYHQQVTGGTVGPGYVYVREGDKPRTTYKGAEE